ncbi:MAG: hypothetical protein K2J84_00790 [Bacteroidaceae bacterium]|nr:hypothetical protein [Bacteroidaceae bacterium]
MITIQNTDGDRRVLLLDNSFALDESPDFPEYLFDVIFIVNDTVEETKAILNSINPITSTKCCYKPLFVASALKGKMGNYDEIIDGYADDWNSMEVLAKVESIIEYNAKIGLNAQEDPIMSSNQFFIRLTRYLISRKKTVLEPRLDVSASTGYVIPVFDLFYRLGQYELSDYFVFIQSMSEKGLFRATKFVNKVYLCPSCLHSHLLYIKTCPRCGQSSIQTEEVIHHFRCANVSPEHTYNFGGQLRCPKCNKILRHIGMDYDRPAIIHTCNTCGNTFIEPKTKTLCTSCHKTHDAEDLIPQDFNIYEITSEGKQSIISPNIGFTIYTEFYDNYIEYNRFVSRIRLLAEQKFSGNITGDLLVGKIWILNEEGETMPIRPEEIELVCLYFPNNKVSAANNITYVGSVIRDYAGDTEEEIINFQVMMSETLRAAVPILKPGEKICYTYMKLQGNQSTIGDFIKEMDYISVTPDDTAVYAPVEESQKQ